MKNFGWFCATVQIGLGVIFCLYFFQFIEALK